MDADIFIFLKDNHVFFDKTKIFHGKNSHLCKQYFSIGKTFSWKILAFCQQVWLKVLLLQSFLLCLLAVTVSYGVWHLFNFYSSQLQLKEKLKKPTEIKNKNHFESHSMIFPSDIIQIRLFLCSTNDLESRKFTEAQSCCIIYTHFPPAICFFFWHRNFNFCFQEQRTDGLLDSLYIQNISTSSRAGSILWSSAWTFGA